MRLLLASIAFPLLASRALTAQPRHPSCPGGIYIETQVTQSAQFVADSTLPMHPVSGLRSPRNVAQFVVDTVGHVAPGTFKVVKVADFALVSDAERALARWRFRPAVKGGHPVCQFIQSPISKQ